MTMSTAVIGFVLLVIVVVSWFSLWQLYSVMRRIEKKLTLILRGRSDNLDNKVGNTDDASH
jgi:hypothetical protein